MAIAYAKLYEIIHKKVKDEKDRNIETKRGWL